MKIGLAFEQEVPPDLDLTTTDSYKILQRFGFPHYNCLVWAAADYRKLSVVNPGYESNCMSAMRKRYQDPKAFADFVARIQEEDQIRQGPYWYEI